MHSLGYNLIFCFGRLQLPSLLVVAGQILQELVQYLLLYPSLELFTTI
ncbi:hypothetical protein BVRB_9g206050 [Beta vulgaris subsp. vulgaris]|uniref:Uncharacterized protein n=1 Tax=Beta vulgaris subsp. vulgaris TaxID=3555 RepID=A0A0J8BQR8_BETVV|nr:hypothetical protein BVRB_9g206050 [Beta vulgaris subsp. vulgaris]